MAQVGFEPTASLVLSQGGLPIAYRAVLVSGQLSVVSCERDVRYLPLTTDHGCLTANSPGRTRTVVVWV